jgi:hypothetical protein
MSSNLIDLNCEVAPPPMPLLKREHDYVNDMVINSSRDVFDMRECHHAFFRHLPVVWLQDLTILCSYFRAIQCCCTSRDSGTCFPEGATATRGLVPWTCESAGGRSPADTGLCAFVCCFVYSTGHYMLLNT